MATQTGPLYVLAGEDTEKVKTQVDVSDVPVSDPKDRRTTPGKRLHLTSKSPKLLLPVESDSSVGHVTQRRCLWRRAPLHLTGGGDLEP